MEDHTVAGRGQIEVIWIAHSSRVLHVSKLTLIAQGAHIQQCCGYHKVEHEVTIDKSTHCHKEERKYG